MTKYKVVGEHSVFGLEPGGVLEADEVLGIKGYDLNALVKAGHLAVVSDDTPVGPKPKPVKEAKQEAPKAKPAPDKSKEDAK